MESAIDLRVSESVLGVYVLNQSQTTRGSSKGSPMGPAKETFKVLDSGFRSVSESE